MKTKLLFASLTAAGVLMLAGCQVRDYNELAPTPDPTMPSSPVWPGQEIIPPVDDDDNLIPGQGIVPPVNSDIPLYPDQEEVFPDYNGDPLHPAYPPEASAIG